MDIDLKNTKESVLYIVVPCYNEEEVLLETATRLKIKLLDLIKAQIISHNSKILFVNDGSNDKTWKIIKNLHENHSIFSGVDLTRNRGHQNALLAGLMVAKDLADVTISMDADLQDDIRVIDDMIKKYYQGYDIIYGVRSSRQEDTFFKRITAELFYKFLAFMGGDIVFNHADCRLMSKRSLISLSKFKEVNIFLRGIVPLIGYRTAIVEYSRGKRFAGESKYPLKKMLALALEGITSLSIRPLRIITFLGFIIFSISFLMSIWAIYQWFNGIVVSGWTSLICSIWAIGGLILISLGIIGEYIGKIYLEVKARPRFLIKEILNRD